MVDAELVRELLRDQHPDLAGLTITHGADGWAVWRALGSLFIAHAGPPGGKPTWGPPAVASLHRLVASENACR
ncbi:hypothetical protein JIG36_38935 [Actinoplanes sp. LDG1-06]|uniref:Uncharacterized protein n=1 Tax=Paractinoplanes ovalisporus TaxID=2810368 RepID=A0ABS2ANR4_9ACTN|nr:hypothetical protein [Actinoplanes ovalisporus]MBM2621497.1 hypothetical protein [Actinoplanes ovalisporus]